MTPTANDRIDELEETVRQLRELIVGKRMVFPPEWRLNPQEAMLAQTLAHAQSGYKTIDQLKYAISTRELATSQTVLNTVLCRLKKKVPGLRIKNEFNCGYHIDSESRRFLRTSALTFSV
jgi:DNA-binding response OmpR family regulator